MIGMTRSYSRLPGERSGPCGSSLRMTALVRGHLRLSARYVPIECDGAGNADPDVRCLIPRPAFPTPWHCLSHGWAGRVPWPPTTPVTATLALYWAHAAVHERVSTDA